MGDVVIRVEDLSKEYRLGVIGYGTLCGDLASWWARLRGRDDPNLALDAGRGSCEPGERAWALDGVSFDVMRGEALGVIGRNGAGKSTLLKILSRVTTATRGTVRLRGRVASLLEVGTGFHPELTGRENVFLNGAILGMNRREVARKLDEIVAFSGVERYIDTPVKRYSSGMRVRLAFAVAAHLEPEILIIDEVLAVGDAAFQRKCLDKMGEVAGQGRTVLFVSHNMAAVQSLCTRSIWLDGGRLAMGGPAEEVGLAYLRSQGGVSTTAFWPARDDAPGNDQVRLRSVSVRPEGGGEEITVSTPLVVDVEFWNQVPGARLNLSAFLVNEQNVTVFNTAPMGEAEWHGKPFPAGLFRSGFRVPGSLLNDGRYSLRLFVVRNRGEVVSRHDAVLSFDVLDDPAARAGWFGPWRGAVRPRLQWHTEFLEPDDVERPA